MSAVVKFVKKAAKKVVQVVKAIIKDPLPTILSIAGQAVGIPAPVTMALITGARGGDLGDMAKAAAIAYVAPQAASKVASAIAPSVSSAITNEAAAKAVTAATSKALVNGSIAAATGGDFGEAAVGTMAGSLAASGYQNLVAPSVMEKAQALGLDASTAKDISAGLRTGVASGAATAAAGGDFAAGFTTAVADYSIEKGLETAESSFKTSSLGKAIQESPIGTAAEKVSDAYDSVTDAVENAFKKKDVPNTAPLGNGVPNDVVNQVPVSPNATPGVVADADGKEVGTINPASSDDAFNQIVEAFEAPRTPSKQIGEATAALESIGGEKLSEITRGSGTVTDEPLFAGSGFNVGTDQTASPIRDISVDGKNYQSRDVTDETGKTTYYFDPSDGTVTAKPKEFFGADTGASDAETKSLPPIEVTGSKDSIDLEDLSSLYKASTGTPLVPSIAPAPTPSPAPSDLKDLQAIVDAAKTEAPVSTQNPQAEVEAAKAAANDAQVKATIDPTPENIQAAQEAQLAAELVQKKVDGTVQEPSITQPITDIGSAGVQPPIDQAATTEQPTQGGLSAVSGVNGVGTTQPPTIDETNQSVLSAITSGNQTGTPAGTYVDAGVGVPDQSSQVPTSSGGIAQPTDVTATDGSPAATTNVVKANLPTANAAAKPTTSGGLTSTLSGQKRNYAYDPTTGLTLVDWPFKWLQPSMLARGGLVRLKNGKR